MKITDFKGIMASLADAVAYAKGDSARGQTNARSHAKDIRQSTKATEGGLAEASKPHSSSP